MDKLVQEYRDIVRKLYFKVKRLENIIIEISKSIKNSTIVHETFCCKVHTVKMGSAHPNIFYYHNMYTKDRKNKILRTIYVSANCEVIILLKAYRNMKEEGTNVGEVFILNIGSEPCLIPVKIDEKICYYIVYPINDAKPFKKSEDTKIIEEFFSELEQYKKKNRKRREVSCSLSKEEQLIRKISELVQEIHKLILKKVEVLKRIRNVS